MIRAVILDLDDTLFPEHQFVQSGFRAVDQWLCLNRKLDGFYAVAWKMFRLGKRKTIFDESLRVLESEHSPQLIEMLVDLYRNHLPEISLHPDATEFLRLRHSKQKLGLLTDGFLVTQQNKVRSLGLTDQFDAIVYTDQFGREHWKPSEKPFLEMEKLLRLGSEDCVYVADNPTKDFVAPRKLGWHTVKIARADGEYARIEVPLSHQAEVSITSLTELPGLMQNQSISGKMLTL